VSPLNSITALWDGKQMVFGDGDGKFLANFTNSLDVIAHEIGHGVTQYTAALYYRGQSGALNESISDVLGSMAKQYFAEPQETAAAADWLIGEDCLFPGVNGVALRSMKEPGTAYNETVVRGIGKDPQVGHMKDYRQLPLTDQGDWGGVHINSGIPNKAFYLAAVELGGHSWEIAGKIWYHTLLDGRMKPDCDFKTFADLTCIIARSEYDKKTELVVRGAWVKVGVYEDNTPFPVDKPRQ
jgi:Zn-dependent metalloprotease